MRRRPPPKLKRAMALLLELGLGVEEAQDHPQHFGSWFVVGKAGEQRFRVVWDGRDSRLYLQAPSAKPGKGGWDPWEDVWFIELGEGDPLSALRQRLAAT